MPNYINSVNLRENSDFPYLVLDVVDRHPTPRNPGFHVFHWHHDLQLPYVLVGRVRGSDPSGDGNVNHRAGVLDQTRGHPPD